MNSPTTTIEKREIRILPILLLICSIFFLFLEPRIATLLPDGIPTPLAMTWTKAAHITDPQGSTVSLDNALRSGWVSIDPKLEFGHISGYEISNRTEKPFQLQFLTKKYSFLTQLETIAVPPGATRELVKPQQIYPTSGGAVVSDETSAIMRVVISILLLGGALFVILLKRYTPTDRHWAYGTIGTLVGY